jgi:hypothetical protein
VNARPGTIALTTASLAARLLAAQVTGLGPATVRPAWLETWSPLQPRADLPRHLPFVGFMPASLALPPRLGLFWTAGNPAALRDELADTRTDFAIAWDRQQGTWHRPLDPPQSSDRQASAMGWSPVDQRLALLGRVALDQERFEPGSRADIFEAYSSSPFVTLDTSTTPTRHTRVALEGAGGLHLGGWGLGLALGYEARDRETIEAGLIRRTRQVVPAASIGLTRSLGALRFGPYARWRKRAETIFLIERAGQGLAIQLEGLRDVRPLDILSYYYRRIEEDMPSAGWSAAGQLGGGTWALYGERASLRQRLTSQEVNHPAQDTWIAGAWTAGGAYQHPAGRRTLLTLHTRYTTLRGDANLALDTNGVIFHAAEREWTSSAELRLQPDTTGWALMAGVEVRWETRLRDALTVPVAARITAVTNSVVVEVGRALSRRLFAAGTGGYAYYSSSAAFPAPTALGPMYRTYILPEYDVASRPAQSWLGAVSLRWAANAKTHLWTTAGAEQAAPVRPGPTSFGPDGSRSTLFAAAGVSIR